MLGVFNYNRKETEAITLKVDLEALKLVPQLPKLQAIGSREW
jgi:hypothetical protein